MKAPRTLDRLYRNQCLDARLDHLLLAYFGGVEGKRRASAILKAEQAIRFAKGRATKLDRLSRDWDTKQCQREGGE